MAHERVVSTRLPHEGNTCCGTYMEITEESVVVDFNPPLAGKTLNFDVQILSLREAQPDELDHGHPHSLNEYYDEDEIEIDDEE